MNAPKEARAQKRSSSRVRQSQNKSSLRADQGGAQRGRGAPQSHQKTKEREGLARNLQLYFCLFFFFPVTRCCHHVPTFPVANGQDTLPLRVRAKNSKTVNFAHGRARLGRGRSTPFVELAKLKKGRGEIIDPVGQIDGQTRPERTIFVAKLLFVLFVYLPTKKIIDASKTK